MEGEGAVRQPGRGTSPRQKQEHAVTALCIACITGLSELHLISASIQNWAVFIFVPGYQGSLSSLLNIDSGLAGRCDRRHSGSWCQIDGFY